MNVSLVIPIRNEAGTIEALLRTIEIQSLQPTEVVLVDGGSTDDTLRLVRGRVAEGTVRLLTTDGASPGKGRNIGIDAAESDWIALTDAGIELERTWLEILAMVAMDAGDVGMVYGTVEPVIETNLDLCATLAYVPPPNGNKIRRSIASCLIKKAVWADVGGFPDLRAAEDLIFMEAAEKNCKVAFAPDALVHWHLCKSFPAIFRKFVSYSTCNARAGRQRSWHYGVLKQYTIFGMVMVLTLFISWFGLLLPVPWLLLRTLKRVRQNSLLYGYRRLLKPPVILGTMVAILTIDVATFVGWALALRGTDDQID